MTSTVASLSLHGRLEGRKDIRIDVEIGTPYRTSEGEWACPLSIRPLYERLRDVRGEDSFQALFLAMRSALDLLKTFTEAGGLLIMDGEEVSLEANGRFPFEAYTIGVDMRSIPYGPPK